MNTIAHQPARPKNVNNAMGLLCFSLAIEIVGDVCEALVKGWTAGFGHSISNYLLSLLIMILLINKIGLRKNWARIAVLVLFLITVPFDIQSLIQASFSTLISSGFDLVEDVLTCAALVLLFQRDSSAWFRAKEI